MAVVTLTFTGSEEQIVSGVPRYITITSNVPSTIYFTLDGTTPTTDSPIYIDTFEMPDGENSVILSAFGVDGLATSGPILTQVFAPNTTRITVSRNVGLEGFVLRRAGTIGGSITGYDADGVAASFVDVDLETLNLIRKPKGYLGLADGTAIEVGVPNASDTASLIDDGFIPFSTPARGDLFNPNAKMIIVDGRDNNEIRLILRPYGSLHNIYTDFGGKRLLEPADDAVYISGGFVRKFYSAKNNVMVSYYFDHNESRYVKSIQTLPDNIPNTTFGASRYTQPLVFKWLPYGRQSSI